MTAQGTTPSFYRGHEIAVIGIGCRYPGADGPRQLWENVLARRQQFRRIPSVRLPLTDYYDPDVKKADSTYGRKAALRDGFQFDWRKWRIPQSTVERTDIVQWLALEVAASALEDAGLERESLPKERTGVMVGNTLTGEQTRSNSLRLRWPFVRRALGEAAIRCGMSAASSQVLAEQMEEVFKSVFPSVNEDTLAGGLSNTIAGRICNAFDLHGGGFTIDGACSSSLLAVCHAAQALASQQLDLALAGGVDVSLDTFELIGFAKTGALSRDRMRVYDRRADGFIPGEGCGFVILKRLTDARRDGDRVYAVLRGWGISSDGKGGLTAPAVAGQTLALQRAYQMAGYTAADVDFMEGHGTGTRLGDRVELEAICQAIQAAGCVVPRSVGVTSFKSIVGHTKAAAGIGAFIKTVMGLNRRIVPPTAGCEQPHELFASTATCLFPLLTPLGRPERTLKAGVSAMGFGGINCHTTLESGDPPADHWKPELDERLLGATPQVSEVFPFRAASVNHLCAELSRWAAVAEEISQAEMTDLAAHLARHLASGETRQLVRAAVVADDPEALADRLRAMAETLRQPWPQAERLRADARGYWWIGRDDLPDRIGFLFPGQGSQSLLMAGQLIERYDWARQLVAQADQWLHEAGCTAISPWLVRRPERAGDEQELERWKEELARTEIAQPLVCLVSLLHLHLLRRLGIDPQMVAGHSLGELTALHVAGAMDTEMLIKLAGIRGQVMADAALEQGAMASLACSPAQAENWIAMCGGYAVVANINSARQTVVSGDVKAIDAITALAGKAGIAARRLSVSGAFHSRLMHPAAEKLRERSAAWGEGFRERTIPILSSMADAALQTTDCLHSHIVEQMLRRVDFPPVVQAMAQNCEQIIEVGPGQTLTGLANEILSDSQRCLATSDRHGDFGNLNRVLARAFAGGWELNWDAVHDGRLIRPFQPASQKIFIENPCERPFSRVTHEPGRIEPITGQLDSELTRILGVTTDELDAYWQRRGRFVCEVVRADMADLNGKQTGFSYADSVSQTAQASSSQAIDRGPLPASRSQLKPRQDAANPISKAETPISGLHGASAARDEQVRLELGSLLIRLAAERTGFPVESLSGEDRLLDDLNLDSIKAAELVAEAAKMVGVAAKIDPSLFANAKLAEISAALAERCSETESLCADAPSTIADRPLPTGETAASDLPQLEAERKQAAFALPTSLSSVPMTSSSGSRDTESSGCLSGNSRSITPSLNLSQTVPRGSRLGDPRKPVIQDFWLRDFVLEYVEAEPR